jgi:hypothetical protein
MGAHAGYVSVPPIFAFVHAKGSAGAQSKALATAFARTAGVAFQHPPEPMTWVGRCDSAPCPPPPPPPNKALVLHSLAVTVRSADETLGLNTSEQYTLNIAFPNATLAADTV